jgi:hypothetical protein
VNAPLAIAALAGFVAVAAAVVALLTVRLERMAGAVAVAAGALALCGTLARGPGLGGLLALGGVALFAPVAAGAIVVGLDGRPRRTPRAWKLALLLPLPVLVVAVVREAGPTFAALVPSTSPSAWTGGVAATVGGAAPEPGLAVLPVSDDGPTALLALITLAAAALAALLLARRREAT